MKKSILFAIIVSSLGLSAKAQECVPMEQLLSNTNVVFVTQMADGSTNQWNMSDLVQALGLLNRKYHREVATPSGRSAWHGQLTKEVIDADAETKTEYHEDGTSFTFKFKKITPAQAVTNKNATLSVNTNGIPVALAKARLLRAQEKQTTNIVTQVIVTGM